MTIERVETSSRGGAWHFATGLVLALAVWMVPVAAGADSPDALSEKAKAHYTEGQRLYETGEYERAAEHLRKAYALTPMPLLLYNICLAEWRAGNLDEATTMALRARRESLPEGLKTKVDARLDAFSVIRKARGMTGDGNPSMEAELAGSTGPSEHASTSDAPPRFGGLGWIGIGSATLGGVGVTMAVIYNGRVADAVDRMNQRADRGEIEEAERILRDEVEPAKRNGRIFLATGAGLATVGATLIIWDLATVPAESEEAAAGFWIRPSVGVGHVGVKVRY